MFVYNKKKNNKIVVKCIILVIYVAYPVLWN